MLTGRDPPNDSIHEAKAKFSEKEALKEVLPIQQAP